MHATKLKQKDPELLSGSFPLSRPLILLDEGGDEFDELLLLGYRQRTSENVL